MPLRRSFDCMTAVDLEVEDEYLSQHYINVGLVSAVSVNFLLFNYYVTV